MKKYVQEATDINIWTSIKNNTFGRNKDIKEFIDGLELIVLFGKLNAAFSVRLKRVFQST